MKRRQHMQPAVTPDLLDFIQSVLVAAADQENFSLILDLVELLEHLHGIRPAKPEIEHDQLRPSHF